MKKENNTTTFCAHASPSGFIVFGVLFLPICILYFVLFATGKMHGQEYAVVIPWFLLIPFYIWLIGFRIRITRERFEYRDGLWRWHSCLRSQIIDAETRCIKFKNFGRGLQFPRLVVRYKNDSGNMIVINTKPFSLKSIKRARELLNGIRESDNADL